MLEMSSVQRDRKEKVFSSFSPRCCFYLRDNSCLDLPRFKSVSYTRYRRITMRDISGVSDAVCFQSLGHEDEQM